MWNKIENLGLGLSFYNIVLMDLDELVKELKNGTNFDEEYREYIILKIVTLIEYTLKKLIIFLVDERNVDVSDLFVGNLESPKDDIEKKDIPSKGELVIMNFNFQNIKVIRYVFNKLLRINFIDSLKEFLSKPDETGANYLLGITTLRDSNSLLSNWSVFEDMFELRRKIAHSISQDIALTNEYGFSKIVPIETSDEWVPDGYEYYQKMIECTEVFLFMCMFVPILVIDIQQNKSANSQVAIFFKQKMKDYAL